MAKPLKNNMEREKVYKLINGERDYQDTKWTGHKHEVGAYILLLEEYAKRAREQWTDSNSDVSALDMIRKVAGIAVHCMEEHGAPSRKIPV